jgi:predicted Zn finger-like uncharacterized protein
MILTCPECATGYFVEDGHIRPEGRRVRCAACGARWTAYPEPKPAPADDAPLSAEPAPQSAEQIEPPLKAEELPKVFRTRAEEEKRLRHALVGGAAWGSAAVIVLSLVAAAVVFREQVVQSWPQTASVYAAIGLAVNPTGLVIEQVRAEPSLEEGHATLVVTGAIRNVTGHDVLAQPLRISLFNAQGKRVAGQIDSLSNPRVPPGETRRFRTSIFDPPFSAANLQVDFAMGVKPPPGRARAPAPAPAPMPSLTLRGAAAIEAPAPSNAAEATRALAPSPSNAAASPS